jgi:hypothetical protein
MIAIGRHEKESQIVMPLQTFPSVLGFSIDTNLDPKLAWLQERLSLDDKSLGKLVKTLPSVLGMSSRDKI